MRELSWQLISFCYQHHEVLGVLYILFRVHEHHRAREHRSWDAFPDTHLLCEDLNEAQAWHMY